MFRKIVLVALGVSLMLLVSNLFGTSHDRAGVISRAKQMIQARRGPYEAPLRLCDSPDAIQGDYIVCLKRGHSLQQHKETIGIDLSPFMDDFIFEETSTHGLCYGAKFDDARLAIVGADSGVNFVECDLKARLAVLDL